MVRGAFTFKTKDIRLMASNQHSREDEMAKIMKNDLLYEISARLLSK
ncbi:hypothetical protein ACFL1Z_08435 [Thermodesulfobacteriota bacterium]